MIYVDDPSHHLGFSIPDEIYWNDLDENKSQIDPENHI